MEYPLTHQMQPTKDTCMSTCLAMLLDRPVAEVAETWHESFANWETTIGDVLCMEGVPFLQGKGINQTATIYHDYVYLLCMPSPATPGILHQIIMDTRGDKVVIHDPLKGTGKRYYTLDEDDKSPLAVKLETWIVDYIVDPYEVGGYRG